MIKNLTVEATLTFGISNEYFLCFVTIVVVEMQCANCTSPKLVGTSRCFVRRAAKVFPCRGDNYLILVKISIKFYSCRI